MIRKNGIVLHTVLMALGSAVATFGIHQIHRQSGITEGGTLGAVLLLHHWLGLSPAILTPVLDGICYFTAFRVLGGGFIKKSLIATAFVALFFKLWESLPYILPSMSGQPLAAAVLGAVFVGVGVGLIIRQGGSGTGDDALALSIEKITRWPLSRAYLTTDLTVLLLSLSYIPLRRIAFSLITVTLSSYIIEGMQRIGKKK